MICDSVMWVDHGNNKITFWIKNDFPIHGFRDDKIIEIMNVRRNLLFLDVKYEDLIYIIKYTKILQFSEILFAIDSFQLMKMVYTPTKKSAFISHIGNSTME